MKSLTDWLNKFLTAKVEIRRLLDERDMELGHSQVILSQDPRLLPLSQALEEDNLMTAFDISYAKLNEIQLDVVNRFFHEDLTEG